MKTTELFAEQVIIGFFVLLTGWFLTFHSCLPDFEWEKGIALTLVAYILGIIFDRVSDTLTQDFDQNLRLSLGYENWKKDDKVDCFKENIYLIKAIEKGSAVAAYTFYLRSRIRLSRSAAVITPALTVAYLLSAVENSWLEYSLAIAIAAIYAITFLIKVILPESFSPPKTDAKNKKQLEKYFDEHSSTKDRCKLITFEDLATDASFWAFVMTILCGVILLLCDRDLKNVLIFLVGIGLSLLSFWAWLRISKTFKNFIYDYYAIREKTSAADNS